MSERIVNIHPKVYNGKTYRSTLEAQTAKTLDELGIPYRYEERKIVLQEGFRCQYQKDKVRDITYLPDFEIGSCILIECKGFETPEWKIKKKLLFKYLTENEPDTCYYQIHDAKRQLLQVLDHHWSYLGYSIEVTPKPKKKKGSVCGNSVTNYSSIEQAMYELHLTGKPIGAILRSLLGKVSYVYNYNWKLVKLKNS